MLLLFKNAEMNIFSIEKKEKENEMSDNTVHNDERMLAAGLGHSSTEIAHLFSAGLLCLKRDDHRIQIVGRS